MYEGINTAMLAKAKEMLASGNVNRVIGWQKGLFEYDITPAIFENAEELDSSFIYNEFCGPNMSKYLIKESRKEGKILVFLKPCDTYSFNQLIKEHRVKRENIHVLGIECSGKVDVQTLKNRGAVGLIGVEDNGDEIIARTIYGDKTFKKEEVLLEKCQACKGKKHMVFD